jgi:hypothetical protein
MRPAGQRRLEPWLEAARSRVLSRKPQADRDTRAGDMAVVTRPLGSAAGLRAGPAQLVFSGD